MIEHSKGIDAAKNEIERLKTVPDLNEKETKALVDIENYYTGKGNISTIRLLASWYAVYLEVQHGQGSGALLGSLLAITSNKSPAMGK